jgi:multicomponent Na+:H+ antiporter subunit D
LLLLLPPLVTAAATLAAGMLAGTGTTPLAWAKLIAESEYIGLRTP